MPVVSKELAEFKKSVDKDWEESTHEERALTWLVLALSEKDLLYYVLLVITKHGQFLQYYDEDESFLFNNRERLIEVSPLIYKGKWSFENDIHAKYLKWLEKKR